MATLPAASRHGDGEVEGRAAGDLGRIAAGAEGDRVDLDP